MKREILCTPKKDRGQFSCVFLQKPGLVRPPPSSPPLPSMFQKIGFKICQINVTLSFLPFPLRGGDLPLDLQRTPRFPDPGPTPLRLPEDRKLVHR